MPGVIDLSSVIAGMNAAASASQQGGQMDLSIAYNNEPDLQLKKPRKIDGKGEDMWNKQISTPALSKPLAQHIIDSITPPNPQAQDSLLSMMTPQDQQYAINTYNLLTRGKS